MPSRRRVAADAGSGRRVGAGGWALLGGTRANAYYQGPVSDHFDGVRFFNPGQAGPKGRLARFCSWQLSDRGAAWPSELSRVRSPLTGRPHRSGRRGARDAYVGHASLPAADARAQF